MKTYLRSFLSVGVLTTSLLLGTNLYAALNGSYTINAGASASSTNYRTFASLISDLSSGTRADGGTANGSGVTGPVVVTVVNGSGPYTEQITIPQISGMNATNTVTINGNNQILRFAPNTTDRHILRFAGADFFRINNLRIVSTSTTITWGIHMYNASDDNIFDNVEVDLSTVNTTTANDATCLAIANSTTTLGQVNGANGYRNIFRNCFFHGGTSGGPVYALNVCGTSNVMSNNQFLNNRIEDFYAYGFYTSCLGGTIIKGNRISRPNRTANTTIYGFYCINNVNPDNRIEENYITNMFGGAPTSTSTFYGWAWATPNTPAGRPWIVANNVIANVGGRGTRYGVYQNYIQNAMFYHNTFSFDDNPGTSGAGTYYGYYMGGPVNSGSQINVHNNIISITKPTSGASYGVYFDNSQQTYTMNHNVYNIRTAANAYIIYNVGATYLPTALAAWVTASGRDAASKTVDPLFINPGALDFSPSSGAVLFMAPRLPQVLFDINNNARTLNTSPGAFEVASDVAVTSASLANAALCNGLSDQLSASIKNNGPLVVNNMVVGFSVNGVHQAWDTVKQTILVGATANHVFTINPVFTKRGINNVKVYPNRPDTDASNDTALTSINVLAAPSGSVTSVGIVQMGIPNTGDAFNPDVIFPNDTFQYLITPPTGYNNAGHNTTWKMDLNLYDGMTVLPSSFYVYTPASGSGNASVMMFVPASFENKYLELRFKVTELGGNNCDTTFSRYMLVGPKGHAKFALQSIGCPGDDILIADQSSVSSGNLKYFWDFGDGTTAEDVIEPVHQYANAGTYIVKLRVVTDPFGYPDDTTMTITIGETPVVGFVVTNACEGHPVTIQNNSKLLISTGTINYTWTLGDGSPSVFTTNVSHQYASAGAYKVKLVAEYQGCKAELTRNAYSFPNPVSSFNIPPTSVCAGEELEFENTTTLATGDLGSYWRFGDGNISTVRNPKHTYDVGGTYNIKLVSSTQFGCMDSTDVNIFVKERPRAAFSNTPACSVRPTSFTQQTIIPSGQTASHQWSFSDGTQSIQENPVKSWTSLGPKTVNYKVTLSNGCSDEISKELNVLIQPIAAFSIEDICAGELAKFENQTTWPTGNVEYEWDFGDNNSSTQHSPNHFYTDNSTITYNVTLKSRIVGGCTDSVTLPITVNEKPKTCDFIVENNSTTAHRGFQFIPTDGVNPGPQGSVTYTWLSGDGSILNEPSPIYHYTQDGLYTVNMRAVSPNGCDCYATKSFYVNWLSTDDIAVADGIKMYPNPAANVLNIDAPMFEGQTWSIQVFTLTGQLLLSENAAQTTGIIDLSTLASGMYIVKVSNGISEVNRKITVIK